MDTITFGKDVTVVEDCEDAWTAGANVTASLEATIYQRGSGSAKFIVDAAAAAGAVLCYEDFTAVDLTGKDSIAFWIYSTKALAAGELDFMLDNTSACVSPLESIDIPVTAINTWTRHVITIATPSALTAVISCGVKMVTDIGAFTFYIDDVIAFDSKSFNVLAVKGLTKSHSREAWPNIDTVLLDGTLDKKVSRYGRLVTVSLYPIISTEADVTWLMDALTLYPSMRIITSDRLEECDGVHQLQSTEMDWSQGVDWAPVITIPFREKTPIWSATRKPPSWS